MIQAYSKRLLCPYKGQVQIVEADRARAITMDGNAWEIQFMIEVPQSGGQHPESKQSYIRVALMTGDKIQHIALPTHLQNDAIDNGIQQLAEYLKDVRLPLPAADDYEYWLLDEADESPIALIYSCTSAEQMPHYPSRPEWTALPSAQMKVEPLPEEDDFLPPVNYRLEQLINERAGRNPKARWIKRREGLDMEFPACLVTENWENEADRQLCQRYIERQAPRLLMLHGLDQEQRLRLELAAKPYAMEVAHFYPLYPDVADDKLMSAIRVEARLRSASGESSRR